MLPLNRPLGPEFTRSREQRECEPQSIEQRPVKRFVPWSLRPLFVANFTGRCAFSELMSAKNNQTRSLEVYSGPGVGLILDSLSCASPPLRSLTQILCPFDLFLAPHASAAVISACLLSKSLAPKSAATPHPPPPPPPCNQSVSGGSSYLSLLVFQLERMQLIV